jgi:hypothetical protein
LQILSHSSSQNSKTFKFWVKSEAMNPWNIWKAFAPKASSFCGRGGARWYGKRLPAPTFRIEMQESGKKGGEI